MATAPLRLDLRSGRLWRGSVPVVLRPKTWAVLRYLVERPGVLVSKTELLEAVWADVAVTESVLSKSIGELRVALGDSFKEPRCIETVQRRGFRFLAEAQVTGAESGSNGASSSATFGAPYGGYAAVVDDPSQGCFVSRVAELQQLAERLARARAGERQMVFITGQAGIGKTALTEAFLNSGTLRDSGTPIWVARGSCVDQHEPREAYAAVIDALERLARRPDAEHLAAALRRVAPTWLAQLPVFTGHEEQQALRQTLSHVRPERMRREFAALVEVLSADATLVLVLEDLHWSDTATVDLLAVLGERKEAARLLVIGTFRPGDAIVGEHKLMSTVRTLRVRRQCLEISVPDLNPEAVQRYLDIRCPSNNFPPELARRIHKHTDGNPLFMIGVVDYLRAHGLILPTEPGWELRGSSREIDLGIPEDVRLLIENQLDGLSPADRALLQAASVAGNEFVAPVIASVLGVEVAEVEKRCDDLAQMQRFLRVASHASWSERSLGQPYAFNHELYRRAVYARITAGHCMQLHQRVGQALEDAYGAQSMEVAPQLAMHFVRGRDNVRALQYLTVAATRARQRYASREVIGYIEGALPIVACLLKGDEQRQREIELRLLLGAALSDIYGFASELVRENYDRASELCAVAGSDAQRCAVLYARCHLHALRGHRKETTEAVAAFADHARRCKIQEHRILAESASLRTAFYEGRFIAVTRHMRRLLAHQRRREASREPILYGADPSIVSQTHYGLALWFLGDVGAAQAAVSVGLACAREVGNPFTQSAALLQAGLVELLQRSPGVGADWIEQAEALADEHGFSFWSSMAAVLKGWALVQQGQVSTGIIAIERALGSMHAAGARLFSVFAYAFLAEGQLRAGAIDAGLVTVAAGLAMASETLERAYVPELWRLKGELLLARANPDRRAAQRCLLHALELTRTTRAKSLELRVATSLARSWQRRRAAEAGELLGEICKWFPARLQSADLTEARALLANL